MQQQDSENLFFIRDIIIERQAAFLCSGVDAQDKMPICFFSLFSALL
jgi:hypothetical protein